MIKEAPKVAVCMGVHNSDYLEDMLKSLVNQTFKDFTVYLWLDGVEDDTIEVVDKFVDKLDIKYKDASASHIIGTVKNSVVKMALEDSPDYIQMCDCDDVLESEFLEKMVEEIEKGYDFVACDGVQFGEVDGPIQNKMWHDNLQERIKHLNPFLSWIMVRADVMKEFNYREGIKHFEDWDLHYRLVMADKTFSVVQEPLYNYRTHSEQFHKETDRDFTKHQINMWQLNDIENV
jgi:glycosyltransferase involved in cell wall biosynthesis